MTYELDGIRIVMLVATALFGVGCLVFALGETKQPRTIWFALAAASLLAVVAYFDIQEVEAHRQDGRTVSVKVERLTKNLTAVGTLRLEVDRTPEAEAEFQKQKAKLAETFRLDE